MGWLRQLIARWLGHRDRQPLAQLGEGLGVLLDKLRAKEVADAIAYDAEQWAGGAGPFWFDPQRYAGTPKDWLVKEIPVVVPVPVPEGLHGFNIHRPPPMPSSRRRFDVDRARVPPPLPLPQFECPCCFQKTGANVTFRCPTCGFPLPYGGMRND